MRGALKQHDLKIRVNILLDKISIKQDPTWSRKKKENTGEMARTVARRLRAREKEVLGEGGVGAMRRFDSSACVPSL